MHFIKLSWLTSGIYARAMCAAVALSCLQDAQAIDANKSFSQYSRSVWTQSRGLPQDTITAIAQTPDGFLWLGTDEGLARFDGYEFSILNVARSRFRSNSVKSLVVGKDGVLWVGTANGLVRVSGGDNHVYSTQDGLPGNAIDDLTVDHDGNLWIAVGGTLTRYDGKDFQVVLTGATAPIRVVYEDPYSTLWVGGLDGVARLEDGKFTPVIPRNTLAGNLVTKLLVDGKHNLWITGGAGVIQLTPEKDVRMYSKQDGLPDAFVRDIWLDRDGNLWVGTNAGLARLRNGRFTPEGPSDIIRCLFEDRERNLWVGTRNGLNRLRDDVFTIYGKAEGFPSDSPNAVFEDNQRRIWVGFHDNGVLAISRNGLHVFGPKEGFPSAEVFSIRRGRGNDILFSTRAGLVRMHGERFTTFTPEDPFGRKYVFDAMEDSAGRLWAGFSSGLGLLTGSTIGLVLPGGPPHASAVVTLSETNDRTVWAGAYQGGLWRIRGAERRQFTTRDGLSSDEVRALTSDRDGTLWIGTFGGGLNWFRDGAFHYVGVREGLLSDNISNIVDDGEALWLGTPRGICQVSKESLRQFAAGRISRLNPVNYGVDAGLRTAQAAPGFPVSGGGIHSSDGRLWFPTSDGLAVIRPKSNLQEVPSPVPHIVEAMVNGKIAAFGPGDMLKLPANTERLQLRFAAIHLSAPERVEYSYKLEGVDSDWVSPGQQRETSYNNLAHGAYRFLLRASVPSGQNSEQSFVVEKEPKFHETFLFRALIAIGALAAVWGIYYFRVRQIRFRFALVLEERVRLAREIHDTLAQGFVGISSQLEALSSVFQEDETKALHYLDVARKMARHNITEARRALSELRGSSLANGDLSLALRVAVEIWTAGSNVSAEVSAPSDLALAELPKDADQHLLRIAQEAVTNAVKHAEANKVVVNVRLQDSGLLLEIFDDGKGFVQQDPDASRYGHFGLIGMRERTKRMGGDMRVTSSPGNGTKIEVTVPLPSGSGNKLGWLKWTPRLKNLL